jgi:heat shock protein HslJ
MRFEYKSTTIRRLMLLACGAAGAACVTMRANGDLQTLSGNDWRLFEVNGRTAVPAESLRRPWLRFNTDSSRVFGSGGCNRMSGPFTIDGAAMRFGALVSTKMACADAGLNQQETDFFGALEKTDHYALVGDTLVLMRGSEAVARFRP